MSLSIIRRIRSREDASSEDQRIACPTSIEGSAHVLSRRSSSRRCSLAQEDLAASSVSASDLRMFLFEQMNKFAWFCVSTVQEEADAEYILLEEFLQICISCIKVSTPCFDERAASRKATTLFKKYLPPFLAVSPKMSFEMFNMAMIDLVTETLPEADLLEQLIWLGKVSTPCLEHL